MDFNKKALNNSQEEQDFRKLASQSYNVFMKNINKIKSICFDADVVQNLEELDAPESEQNGIDFIFKKDGKEYTGACRIMSDYNNYGKKLLERTFNIRGKRCEKYQANKNEILTLSKPTAPDYYLFCWRYKDNITHMALARTKDIMDMISHGQYTEEEYTYENRDKVIWYKVIWQDIITSNFPLRTWYNKIVTEYNRPRTLGDILNKIKEVS